MTAAFRVLGVDYVQWKAVTKTLLKSDYRLPLTTKTSALGKLGDLLIVVVTMGLFGLAAAFIVFVTSDVLLSGTMALAFSSVMLATMLLTQHGATLLSTADYVILGSRPVSSRTFFAIRMTNVLFHALLLTSLMAYPVVLAYAFAHGVSVTRAIAAAMAIYAWSITVTLGLVASYGTLLRTAGAARFQRAIGYLQMIGGFLAYGGLLLTSRALARSAIADAVAPDVWWLVLVPPAWFASYLELAVGSINSTTLIRAALSAGAMIALAVVLGGKMGLEYARQVAEMSTTAPTGTTPVTRTPFFRNGEARAVALLVVAHFRYDMRVRMGILGILPLIMLYVLIGTGERSFDLVALAVLLFPALLSQHFASTDAYQAAWVYRSTPSNHAALIIAAKNVAVAYFLLPFLLFVGLVFTWRMGDWRRAAVHTAMLGILSHVALQGAIIIKPRLPFALPPDKTRGNASLMAWMVCIILGGQGALVVLDRWVYVSAAQTAGTLVLLAALSWMLNRVIAWRVRTLRIG